MIRFFGFFLVVISLSLPALARQAPQILRDGEIEEILHDFAAPILQAAGIPPGSVEIVVINDPSMNAFVTGGMKIFIHSGLLTAAQSADEVVGVLAHEIGHISGGHLIRGSQALADASAEAILFTILGAAATLASGSPEGGFALLSGGSEIARRRFLKFSRTQESSADQAALTYLEKTNLPANGLLKFMHRLEDQELLPADKQIEYVITHPVTRDRIDAIGYYVQNQQSPDAAFPSTYQDRFDRLRAKLLAYITPAHALLVYPQRSETITASYARAVAYWREGKISQSLEQMDFLLSKEPKNPWFLELKGQILFEDGKLSQALSPYRQAVKLKPKNGLILTSLSHALIESGGEENLQEALTHLSSAVKYEPHSSFTWRLMATAYGKLNQQGPASYALAEEALARGDFKTAIIQSRRAQDIVTNGSSIWLKAQDVELLATRMEENSRD